MRDLDKWRSIGLVGRTRGQVRLRPLREGDRLRGAEIDHPDGRTEAVVRPDVIRHRLSISGEEDR